jgi:hypothetical protein
MLTSPIVDFVFSDLFQNDDGHPPPGRAGAQGEGEMTMRWLVILVAICFSANALAKDKLPKVGKKPLVQVKPKEPMGCKLVGTVKGTKLWAGDCVASELRGATPATETESLPEQAPPDQKQ